MNIAFIVCEAFLYISRKLIESFAVTKSWIHILKSIVNNICYKTTFSMSIILSLNNSLSTQNEMLFQTNLNVLLQLI